MTDLLLQIVLILTAIALVLLMVVLWRMYTVLSDVNEATTITKKRIKSIDKWMSEFDYSIKSITDVVKSFTKSLEKIKDFKNKIVGEETKKEGE